MAEFCSSLTRYRRRHTVPVKIGPIEIGGGNPVAVQSMTSTDTLDTAACVDQILRIRKAGGHIVRLTAQGRRQAENLKNIYESLHRVTGDTALVADIHFLPSAAEIAAEAVDKVRINPGNYNDAGGELDALIDKCKALGRSLRIGVNHGSLSSRMTALYGDTPEGMVASAMEFLQRCREKDFDQVVVSMKSSNTRVMVQAYRLLVKEMDERQMHYPIHLGVTEAGNALDGRIKSAVGIGALLADGIGDTIRVSLTEAPENEIPVALMLTDYFAAREGHEEISDITDPTLFSAFEYRPRKSMPTAGIGGGAVPVIYSELTSEQRACLGDGIVVAGATGENPVAEWRSTILNMSARGDMRPVIIHRSYCETDPERLAVKAAADFGVMFLDGLADGMYLECEGIAQSTVDEISLSILQASRVRMSHTEYIACPGCGRTLYDLESTLEKIKHATGHLPGLKIGVMGCIVNGPGEMADADYGYVGAGPDRITLYRGTEVIRKAIPQSEAIEELVSLLKKDGRWIEPES